MNALSQIVRPRTFWLRGPRFLNLLEIIHRTARQLTRLQQQPLLIFHVFQAGLRRGGFGVAEVDVVTFHCLGRREDHPHLISRTGHQYVAGDKPIILGGNANV